jgi:hypothetical protein
MKGNYELNVLQQRTEDIWVALLIRRKQEHDVL